MCSAGLSQRVLPTCHAGHPRRLSHPTLSHEFADLGAGRQEPGELGHSRVPHKGSQGPRVHLHHLWFGLMRLGAPRRRSVSPRRSGRQRPSPVRAPPRAPVEPEPPSRAGLRGPWASAAPLSLSSENRGQRPSAALAGPKGPPSGAQEPITESQTAPCPGRSTGRKVEPGLGNGEWRGRLRSRVQGADVRRSVIVPNAWQEGQRQPCPRGKGPHPADAEDPATPLGDSNLF